jgi:hypothetical protein
MPAVFQIVSRSSGMALGLSESLPVSGDTTVNVVQVPQNDQDPSQMWVLRPRDPEDTWTIKAARGLISQP